MKIAIVKLSAMGDIIHAMVALQFIKKHNPNIHITWIVENVFVEVLKFNTDVDDLLTVNLKAIKKDKKKVISEIQKLRGYRNNKFDIVIDAQGLIKSAFTAKLLGGKTLWGFSKNSIRESLASYFYDQKVAIAYNANTIDRNMKVLTAPFDFRLSSQEIIDKKPFLFYKNEDNVIYKYLSQDKKNIIFIIGSTWKSRNYPKEHFTKVADMLKENILVSWGNSEEKSWAEWIASHSQYATILPQLDLNSLKAVIAKSDLLIGNDTGPTHMAWGLNVPSLTIFGPTPVNRVYQTPINHVLKSSSKVDHYKLNKHDYSICDITPDSVVLKAKQLLEGETYG